MALDFALNDLKLYLDTHPNDKETIELYNNVVNKRKVLFNDYQQICGPLLAEFYSGSENYWKWVDQPWPWDKEEGGC